MQTPPNNSPQKSQREPLRWLAIAALLLAFLSICCVAQAVTFLLAPRNRISDLDLRSKILVDYAPWGINIPLPGIAPEVPAAQAADRATATSLALLGTPTPVIVGNLPTVELPFVPPVDNAPLPTPDNPLDIPPTPTATSRAIAGGAATPTSAQVATRGAEATNTSVPPTEIPRANSPTATNRSQQPTRTATSQPTIANTSLPNSTSTPTKEPAPRPTATHTPRPNNTSTTAPTNTSIPKEQATPTNTQRPTDKPAKTSTPTITPKPPATNTPRPTATNTPQAPTATNTPRPTVTNTPRPTVTNTARPTATDTPTPTATDTPTPTATDTPTPTATDTPQPATDTPTPTVVPIDVVKTASVTSAQNNAAVTYRIRITNTTGIPVTITQIQDTFDFFFVSSCQSPSGGTCTVPIVGPGGTLSWDGSVTLADTQTMDLLIQGHFENAPVGTQVCNPSYTVRWDQGQPITHDSEACINILP